MISFGALYIANRYHWKIIRMSGLLGADRDRRTYKRKMAEIEMEDMIR